ncbi:MAG TPA: group II intron reverse transcriptase/maturase [Terriglobales bacterium]|nr:group II intron reverse transcriptase/maturase [Terriglobales bacterium]
MNVGQQKNEQHHGGADMDGTHATPQGRQQTFTAFDQQRALTVNLMEQICDPRNIIRAYRRVYSNKGKPGVDGMTVDELADWLRENSVALTTSLLDGTYRPQPVLGVQIPKPGGGIRQLGIPTVVDRLVQQMILQVLEPFLDPTFSNSSYGFRPGRSPHMALEQARKYVAQEGRTVVVDLDLEKFFDRVNHDILMSRLARRIGDKRLLLIIRCFLQAGMMQDGVCIAREEGTPQGGPLSPLLANLLLDDLDQLLESRGHRFCRYADDCNIYVQSLVAGQRVMESVTRFLEGKLKLKVNRDKSAVAPVGERKFLGYRLLLNGKLGISPKSVKRAKERIREITRRNRGVSFAQVIQELKSFITGWVIYYRLAACRAELQSLDEWIRRKLRCYRLKQCKRGKTVAKFLQQLGVRPSPAYRVVSSGRGWWRLSRTRSVQTAMSTEWLASQGLVSLVVKYDSF